MSLLDALSKTEPNRPVAVEDVFDADFHMLFGSEPRGPKRGGRWTTKHFADIAEWRELRRSFKGLLSVDLPEATVSQVVEETQGVPVPWEDQDGNSYVAVIQPTVRLRRISLAVFVKLPPPAAAEAVLNNILHRGGFVDPFPARHHPRLKEINAANKEAFGG